MTVYAFIYLVFIVIDIFTIFYRQDIDKEDLS